MHSIVKVIWSKNSNDKWYAKLFLAGKHSFKTIPLIQGDEINFEVMNQRRCTGYSEEIGERTPCPRFNKIQKGSKCFYCSKKDIYTEYVRGNRGMDTDKKFSVYLVQIGSRLKVGVTRSEKLERRWVEQGADFAAEIFSELTSEKALEKEKMFSSNNSVSQRIRKEEKVTKTGGNLVKKFLQDKGLDGDTVDMRKCTVYPKPSKNLRRKGRLTGKIRSVKGQIISTKRVSMVMTSGKVVKKPVQKGLTGF